MSKKPKIEIVIRNYEQFKNFAVQWADHDFEADPRALINKRWIKRKTPGQNATIHMLIRRLAEHTGDDFEYLKEAFKAQFGPQIHIDVKGMETAVSKGISDYDKEEASAMIEKILYIASDHYGLYLEIEEK
jgi:hypothetical protein